MNRGQLGSDLESCGVRVLFRIPNFDNSTWRGRGRGVRLQSGRATVCRLGRLEIPDMIPTEEDETRDLRRGLEVETGEGER